MKNNNNKRSVLQSRHDILKLHESVMNVQEFAYHLMLYQSAVSTILEGTNKYFYARVT